MRRRVVFLALATALLVACGGESTNTDAANTDATATRAVELSIVATLQAERVTPTSTASPTPIISPTATPRPDVPTPTPEPTATPTLAPSPTVPRTPTTEPTATDVPESDLFARLPTIDDMPSGFAMVEETKVTKEEIASTWHDPNEALDRLTEWGFRQGAEREFEIPSPGLNDAMQRMVVFRAGALEYASEDAANAAMEYSREEQLRGRDGIESTVVPVSVQALGDRSIAAQGSLTADGTTAIIAVIWVRDGAVVFRYAGLSLGHNSLDDIIAIAAREHLP
jgi:hypothetical protein